MSRVWLAIGVGVAITATAVVVALGIGLGGDSLDGEGFDSTRFKDDGSDPPTTTTQPTSTTPTTTAPNGGPAGNPTGAAGAAGTGAEPAPTPWLPTQEEVTETVEKHVTALAGDVYKPAELRQRSNNTASAYFELFITAAPEASSEARQAVFAFSAEWSIELARAQLEVQREADLNGTGGNYMEVHRRQIAVSKQLDLGTGRQRRAAWSKGKISPAHLAAWEAAIAGVYAGN